MIKINELLIANGQLVAETLRHLANNEIDSDYFAVTSECESYGTEVDCEFAITDYARQAAVTVDQLVAALEAAERERDELITQLSVATERVGINFERAKAAEAELARRDAAAGEPFAYIDSAHIDEFGWGYAFKHSSPIRMACESPVYAVAQPAVLPPELSFNEALQLMHEYMLVGDANSFLMGANWMRAQAMALGAQQQNVVELPMPFDVAINLTRTSGDIEYQYHESGENFDRDEIFSVLDAANVKYEVKK